MAGLEQSGTRGRLHRRPGGELAAHRSRRTRRLRPVPQRQLRHTEDPLRREEEAAAGDRDRGEQSRPRKLGVHRARDVSPRCTDDGQDQGRQEPRQHSHAPVLRRPAGPEPGLHREARRRRLARGLGHTGQGEAGGEAGAAEVLGHGRIFRPLWWGVGAAVAAATVGAVLVWRRGRSGRRHTTSSPANDARPEGDQR